MHVCIFTQGDSIGPLKIRYHQNLPVNSVHTGLLNFSRLTPVGPVQETTGGGGGTWTDLDLCLDKTGTKYQPKGSHKPGERVYSNRRRLLQASVKQNLDLCAVEVGYWNCFGAKVRPVQVFIDPVHSNPHRSLDIIHHFTVYSNVSSFVQHRTERYKIRGNASTFKISNRLVEIYRAQWIFP